MRRQSIARSDVSSLSVPPQISVPEPIEETTALLDDVGGLLSAGHWGTAACVWAFTEDQQGSNQHQKKVSDALGIQEFASLGIRGLTSAPSVRKYRRARQQAIDNRFAVPAEGLLQTAGPRISENDLAAQRGLSISDCDCADPGSAGDRLAVRREGEGTEPAVVARRLQIRLLSNLQFGNGTDGCVWGRLS